MPEKGIRRLFFGKMNKGVLLSEAGDPPPLYVLIYRYNMSMKICPFAGCGEMIILHPTA